MLQEVPIVCPKCETKSVGQVKFGRHKIRHDGHYERDCPLCIMNVIGKIGETVLCHGATTVKPEPSDEVPNLFKLIGFEKHSWASGQPNPFPDNIRRINESNLSILRKREDGSDS